MTTFRILKTAMMMTLCSHGSSASSSSLVLVVARHTPVGVSGIPFSGLGSRASCFSGLGFGNRGCRATHSLGVWVSHLLLGFWASFASVTPFVAPLKGFGLRELTAFVCTKVWEHRASF